MSIKTGSPLWIKWRLAVAKDTPDLLEEIVGSITRSIWTKNLFLIIIEGQIANIGGPDLNDLGVW